MPMPLSRTEKRKVVSPRVKATCSTCPRPCWLWCLGRQLKRRYLGRQGYAWPADDDAGHGNLPLLRVLKLQLLAELADLVQLTSRELGELWMPPARPSSKDGARSRRASERGAGFEAASAQSFGSFGNFGDPDAPRSVSVITHLP